MRRVTNITTEVKFLESSAAYLYNDRPDLFSTQQDAYETLAGYVDSLREAPEGSWVSFGSYVLNKWVDEGSVEWVLTRKISTLAEFPEDNDAYAVSHLASVDLPAVDTDLAI